MANIAVRTSGTGYGDSRVWVYADQSEQRGRASITLDITKFTAGTHYPNGYLPSGLVLGKVTATGLYGPYDNAAVDGREVAAGFLWDAFTPTSDKEVAPLWVGVGLIKESKLPIAIDTAGKTDLASWFKFF